MTSPTSRKRGEEEERGGRGGRERGGWGEEEEGEGVGGEGWLRSLKAHTRQYRRELVVQ